MFDCVVQYLCLIYINSSLLFYLWICLLSSFFSRVGFVLSSFTEEHLLLVCDSYINAYRNNRNNIYYHNYHNAVCFKSIKKSSQTLSETFKFSKDFIRIMLSILLSFRNQKSAAALIWLMCRVCQQPLVKSRSLF